MTGPTGWWVVVPMKDTRLAKSRLQGAPAKRRQLAILMARDTLCAVVNAESVDGVVVVCDRVEDVESFALPGVNVVVHPGLSLNDAVRAGADVVQELGGPVNVAALPGDLPYLRSSELEAALDRALRWERTCVGDRTGTGTTLITAASGLPLLPAYGVESLVRHQKAGAVELGIPAWSGLRRDVDLSEDLRPSASLGFRTKQFLEDRLGLFEMGGVA